jgi:hypothetical protein
MTIAPDAVAIRALLEDFSIEMTGKDVRNLEAARSTIPPGTRVNVAFLGNEDLDMRLAAAAAVKRCGLVPVPHISARRLPSADALGAVLAALRRAEASANVFVVGGDPAKPEGPYEDALGVIRTGLLPAYAVRHVGIAGYPEGHPDIGERALWSSLEAKVGEIDAAGLTGTIITQLGFDADPVLAWVEDVRKRGIDLPIRVGVPGPAWGPAATRLRGAGRRRNELRDREEVRILNHEPGRHHRARPLHPRAGRRLRRGPARGAAAALLHVRRNQRDLGVDRRVQEGGTDVTTTMKTRPAASGELTEVREVASLVLDGRDQTGIVAAVGSLLRDHGANIAHSTAELQRRGADVERAVLSRAVLWHAEDRIIRIGNHTVVFG